MNELKHFTPYLYHVIAELDNIDTQLVLFNRNNKHRLTREYYDTIESTIPTLRLLSKQLEAISNLFE